MADNQLGLIDRLRLGVAQRALTGLSQVDPQTAFGLVFGVLGKRGSPPSRTTKEFLLAYSKQPWLRAVSWKIAISVAAVEWKLFAVRGGPQSERFIRRPDLQLSTSKDYRQSVFKQLGQAGEILEIVEHPFLDLLRDANPFHVGTTVRRLQQLYLELTGEYFSVLEREPEVTGIPVRQWPIPPHWVAETPTPSNPFYLIRVGAWERKVPFTEVVWICDANPLNPYGRGTSVSQSLGDELDISEYVSKFTKSFFWNQARPDLLIMHDGANPEQMASLQNYWDSRHRSFWRAFRPLFLNFVPTIKEFTKDLNHLKITELGDKQRDTILQTFGVPPEVLGVLENSNRATITAAEHIFATTVLVPRLELLRDTYQERLIPEYDERLIIDYVSPVESDHTFELEAAKAAPWTLMVDEWREIQGKEPLPDEKGQIFGVPFNILFTRELLPDILPEEPGALVPEITPPTPESMALGNGRPSLITYRDSNGVIIDQKLIAAPEQKLNFVDVNPDDPFYILVHRIADRLEPEVRRTFLRSIDDMLVALDDKAERRFIAAIRGGNIPAAMRQLPWGRFEETFREIEIPLRQAVGLTGSASANELSSLLGLEEEFLIAFSAANPAAVDWARRNTALLVTQVSEESQRAIREMIIRGIREGEDAVTTARRVLNQGLGLTSRQTATVDKFRRRLIEQEFNPLLLEDRVDRFATAWRRRRAIMIARTETIDAANMGQQLVWEKAVRQGQLPKDRVRKIWITTPDDRLDTIICEPMPFMEENQDVPVDGFFITGTGQRLSQPTAHPLCRCTTALEVLDKPRGQGGNVIFRLSRIAASLIRLMKEEPESRVYYKWYGSVAKEFPWDSSEEIDPENRLVEHSHQEKDNARTS